MEIMSGSCGNDVFYTLEENGKAIEGQDETGLTLTVSGRGDMTDYESAKEVPWHKFRCRVTDAVFTPGVKSLGDCALSGCENLTSLKLPRGLRFIGVYGLKGCAKLKKIKFPEGLEIIGPKAVEECTGLSGLILPSTLYSVDFKAFKGCGNLRKIRYNGSEDEFARCVRISESANGNRPLFEAEYRFRKESSRFYKMCAAAGRVCGKGDGKLHILVPDLTVRGNDGKSGDCSLIIFPDGETMLIDAGASFAQGRVMEFIKATGLTHLDYFVLTHPHGDHLGNAVEVAKYIIEDNNGTIDNYWYCGYASARGKEKSVEEYFGNHGAKLNLALREGQIYNIGGVKIEIFNPDEEVLHPANVGDGTVNDTSIAMKLSFGDSTYLTCGDLYLERERFLAAKYGDRLHADVMKTNHHCLYTSNGKEWFAAVRPGYLVSCEDGCFWSRFDERMKKAHIKNYKVSEHGLVHIICVPDGKYNFKTEF